MRTTVKAFFAAIVGLGLFLVMAGAALAAPAHSALPAHAKVLSSDPGIGSTINHAPTKVTVTAAENINPDPAKSNLVVYGPGADATATVISQGNAQIPLSNPKQMSITITPDSAHVNGVYIVMWKTVSADDGDPASGAFSFTVNTNAASTGSTPVPSTSQQQTTLPASTSSSTGTPIWVPIVTGLAALLVGLGLGRFTSQRKATPSSFSVMRAAATHDAEQEEVSKKP